MKSTTSWKFRKKHLSHFHQDHFKNSWDYFIYLHLNDTTRYLHLIGTLIGVALFPWAMYHFFASWNVGPTFVFVFFYYGFGFISHYICDGQISQTWKQLMLTYKYAVRMNLLSLFAKYSAEEKRFKGLYPETLWVYKANLQPPEEKKISRSSAKAAEDSLSFP